MFGKMKEKKREEDEVDEVERFVDVIAQKLFEKYGEDLASLINAKISPRLENIENKIKEHERILNELEATSGVEKVLRSVFEVKTEEVARKAVEHATKKVNIERIEGIVSELRTMNNQISNTLASLSESLGKLQEALDNFNKNIDNLKEEFSKSVEGATKVIENALNIDESKIESILTKVVEKKVEGALEDVKKKLNELEGLGRNISQLISAVNKVEELDTKLSEISSEIENIRELVERRVEELHVDEVFHQQG